jgi:hypothetical protein
MNMQPPRVPAAVPRAVGAMLQQSNARVLGIRDMQYKFQRALQSMQSEAQDLALRANGNPAVAQGLVLGQGAVMQAAQQVWASLEQAAQTELLIQGELKRWLAGFPPSPMTMTAPPAPLAEPAPPAAPPAAGPMPAPTIHAPVQQAPGIASQPTAGPLPVVAFASPEAAKAAVEATNGATPVMTALPAASPAPAPTKTAAS